MRMTDTPVSIKDSRPERPSFDRQQVTEGTVGSPILEILGVELPHTLYRHDSLSPPLLLHYVSFRCWIQ